MQGGFGRRAEIKTAHSYAALKASGDNRFAPRRSSQIPAQIYFVGKTVSVTCLIQGYVDNGCQTRIAQRLG